MCSLDTKIFKDNNIRSLSFSKLNKRYVQVNIIYNDGSKEDIVIRKFGKYKNHLVSSLEYVYNKIRKEIYL